MRSRNSPVNRSHDGNAGLTRLENGSDGGAGAAVCGAGGAAAGADVTDVAGDAAGESVGDAAGVRAVHCWAVAGSGTSSVYGSAAALAFIHLDVLITDAFFGRYGTSSFRGWRRGRS